MLGFVLSCHKMDDNYDQHTCDCQVHRISVCETKIYNTKSQSFGNGYNHIAIVSFTCSFPQRLTTNLFAYHDGGDLHNRGREKGPGEIDTNAYLNIFSIFVRCHDLYQKMGNVCRNRLLGDMLNERAKLHWQPLFTLCERQVESVINTITHEQRQASTACAPFSFQRMNSRAC